MPCYTPLDAFEVIGKHNQKANGKKTILFTRPQQTTYKEVTIPCGQCIGCKLTRSVTWASRCMHEAKEHDQNCFITLTYDEHNLPQDHSLRKDHFQKFLKRFRKAIHPQKIRYFMCGEYGDDSWRPHYHAIIFGYDFTSGTTYNKKYCGRRQQIQSSEVGNPYYISPLLSQLWPDGFHLIAECTWETAAYVARYCTKKITGDQAEEHYTRTILDWNEFTGEIFEFRETELLPEYGTMSTRPGIGNEWFKKYKSDCYPSNFLIQDGRKTPIPKYYDKLLEQENEIEFKAIKIARELALLAHKQDLTPERLKQRHITKLAQANQLKRNKI